MNGCFTASGMVSNGMSVKMSDYPERISISPVHRQKRDDDFYLVDRKAFPDKGVEYVRADRIEELEAKLEKAMRYFDEAMYFIDLDEEDILKGAGVYRIAKAYAELGAVIPAEWDAAIKHVAELKGQDDG